VRFFIPSIPAGRIEYFVVSIVVGLVGLGINLALFDLQVDVANQELVSYNRNNLALFIAITLVLFVINIINMLRRIKDTGRSSGIIILAFIPLVNIVFGIWLILAGPEQTASYAPYGDDPYNPDSWVKTPDPNVDAGPSVSYQGKELLLPGEHSWSRGDESEAA